MRKHQKSRGSQRRHISDEVFLRRAEKFQTECGWCGKSIDEDDPAFSTGGRAQEGIDLSAVQGKVIEILFERIGKTILAGISAFDSPAKAEGHDLIFMTCCEECGRHLQVAFNDERSAINSGR